MASESPETEVIARLKEFFEAMGRWEADCKASYKRVKRGEADYEAAKSEWITSLKGLFRKYCTTWERPNRARYGIQFSLIPTYGSGLEDVISVDIRGNHAKVTTQQRVGPKDRLVYRLTYDGQQWRVDDNRKRIDYDGMETDWDL